MHGEVWLEEAKSYSFLGTIQDCLGSHLHQARGISAGSQDIWRLLPPLCVSALNPKGLITTCVDLSKASVTQGQDGAAAQLAWLLGYLPGQLAGAELCAAAAVPSPLLKASWAVSARADHSSCIAGVQVAPQPQMPEHLGKKPAARGEQSHSPCPSDQLVKASAFRMTFVWNQSQAHF